jgi:hypothetical protein
VQPAPTALTPHSSILVSTGGLTGVALPLLAQLIVPVGGGTYRLLRPCRLMLHTSLTAVPTVPEPLPLGQLTSSSAVVLQPCVSQPQPPALQPPPLGFDA